MFFKSPDEKLVITDSYAIFAPFKKSAFAFSSKLFSSKDKEIYLAITTVEPSIITDTLIEKNGKTAGDPLRGN